jgi:hypothetical protein
VVGWAGEISTGALRRIALVVALVTAGAVLGTTEGRAAAPAYTALGDSYSSGEGTRAYYPDGTSCHRSPHAYPALDAGRLGASLTFAACSGATTAAVLSGQLGNLSAATAYVTVSVGGDDAGFTHVIERCALPWPITCWGAIDAANALIAGTLPARLDRLYSRIRVLAPHAKVVVAGYPRLFNGQQCNALARISQGEQSALNHSADLLATTTGARAAAHGFAYVDARPTFTGHAICDPVEWVNGLSDPITESYHPNRDGQLGYASIVQAALSVSP